MTTTFGFSAAEVNSAKTENATIAEPSRRGSPGVRMDEALQGAMHDVPPRSPAARTFPARVRWKPSHSTVADHRGKQGESNALGFAWTIWIHESHHPFPPCPPSSFPIGSRAVHDPCGADLSLSFLSRTVSILQEFLESFAQKCVAKIVRETLQP